ncbi:hypothetical protein HMPREF1527_01402 [Atopobium sp. oral taxon 199 str. F0494]|nr:hypothetical protein HMPREF1527_01402 [Atopobium sp. oral taxon 199 str. F0494]
MLTMLTTMAITERQAIVPEEVAFVLMTAKKH